jgi:hypothetical protein
MPSHKGCQTAGGNSHDPNVPDSVENWFQRAARVLDRHASTAALVLGGVGLGFVPSLLEIFYRDGPWAKRLIAGGVFILILLLYTYGTREQARRGTRVVELEAENESLRNLIRSFGSDYPDIWAGKLQVLGEELGFTGDDRVSLYRYDETDQTFSMVARHSEHPDLRKPGRSVYPAGQGVIGRAWNASGGCAFVDDLPDPTTDGDGYRRISDRDWNLPTKVLLGLAMHSRTIGAYALKRSVPARVWL